MALSASAQTKITDLDFYLLIGQSNMAGRTPIGENDSLPIAGCYLLDYTGEWEIAQNPLNKYSTVRKDLSKQRMGPGYSFAKAMLEQDKSKPIGLVVNAKGGTRIEGWAKGTPYYDEAIKRAKAAQKHGNLKGVLWHQGEANASDPSTYLADLKLLVTNLREDLGLPDLPFVAGQVCYHPNNRSHKEINEVMMKLSSVLPFTSCASAVNLTTHDNLHFDTKSIIIFGQRYAKEMLKIQATQKTR
ncbi:MAG: sialate O-acetylesterase [Flavobacteriales bacterium]|nr:sialate O-acetylesterase [Flavobacteriales bacterium]